MRSIFACLLLLAVFEKMPILFGEIQILHVVELFEPAIIDEINEKI